MFEKASKKIVLLQENCVIAYWHRAEWM